MPAIDSILAYENLIYNLPNEYPHIEYSTLVLKRTGPNVGEVGGTVFFEKNIRLNVKELLGGITRLTSLERNHAICHTIIFVRGRRSHGHRHHCDSLDIAKASPLSRSACATC